MRRSFRHSFRPSLAATAVALLSAPTLSLGAPSSPSEVPSQLPSQINLRLPAPSEGCPVGLSVERRSPTEFVNTANSPHRGDSQRIRLTFTPLDSPAIRTVDLTVHAFSNKAQILPAATRSSSGIDRSFQISGPRASGLSQKDLWVDRIGGVTSVELNSITYVDGSVWHKDEDSTCRAVPNNLILVDLTATR